MLARSIIVVSLTVLACQGANAWWYFGAPPSAPTSDNLKAQALFDLEGVSGYIKFSQKSGEPSTTLVEYDLKGLQGNINHYHVHVNRVPDYKPESVKNNATALAELCGASSTGGHLNPFNIKEKLPAKSAPFERYEIGDLSGKYGPMQKVQGEEDHYKGSVEDKTLPLKGENGVIDRSVVIHKNDGKRWVCATIKEIQ